MRESARLPSGSPHTVSVTPAGRGDDLAARGGDEGRQVHNATSLALIDSRPNLFVGGYRPAGNEPGAATARAAGGARRAEISIEGAGEGIEGEVVRPAANEPRDPRAYRSRRKRMTAGSTSSRRSARNATCCRRRPTCRSRRVERRRRGTRRRGRCWPMTARPASRRIQGPAITPGEKIEPRSIVAAHLFERRGKALEWRESGARGEAMFQAAAEPDPLDPKARPIPSQPIRPDSVPPGPLAALRPEVGTWPG